MGTRHRARFPSRTLLSIVLAAGLLTTVANPAIAQPDQPSGPELPGGVTDQVPDPGARPTPNAQVELPDGAGEVPTLPELPPGPLAAEIAAVEVELAALTEELTQLTADTEPAGGWVAAAQQAWETAVADRIAAEENLTELAGDAFRGSTAVPAPLFTTRLSELSMHAPLGVDPPLGAEAAARKLARAQETEQVAADALAAAEAGELSLADQIEQVESDLAALADELADLHERNAEELVTSERDRERDESERVRERGPDLAPVDGMQAHPKAVAAVEFALAQLGKPYQWGAEGPHSYDCSGLMWDAYRSVGITLPRVAADQYWGTRDQLITRSASTAQQGLLPGDLVFFSDDPYSWQAIGHVGMYVGGGKMVHAPTTGDVVKVSPVFWSRFFAATRVVGAVPDPNPPDQPSTPPTSPGTSPPPAPPPKPIVPPKPPTGSPDPPTGSPEPPPSGSPTPTPSPSSSPSPSSDPTPSSSSTPSSDPTPSHSPSPTPTPSPSSTPSSTLSRTPTTSAPSSTTSAPSSTGSESPPATPSATD